MSSMHSDDRPPCRGGAAFAPGKGSEFSPGSSWTGLCPECGGRFELGYGGMLPHHAPAANLGSQGE